MAVCALELLARVTGAQPVQDLACAFMLIVIVLAARRLSLREIYLICASLVLSILVIWSLPNPGTILRGALEQGAFLMSFILLLSLLQATAARSPSVATVGAFLTQRPTGQRYLALSGGVSLLAVLFNIGVVSFLVPLIQNGIRKATPDDPLNPIRKRRQLSALLRGFAWSVTWSPTAFAPLIVADLMPGVQRGTWIGYGLVLFCILLFFGWLEDRLRFRHYRPKGVRPVMDFPVRAALLFVATTLWFLALVLLVIWAFEESVVFGVLAACPLMVAGWLLAQEDGPPARAIRALPRQLARLVATNLPDSVNVAITLAASGFVGRAAASLVPATEVAEAMGLAHFPDWVLLATMPTALAVISLLALSPTMLAVFMGSFFAALPELPADATLIAFSISCGWALSMTFSPFATVVLIIARGSGIPAHVLTLRWNLGFTLIATALLFPIFFLMTGGQ